MVVESYVTMRFCVRNQGTRIWFGHEIDLMDKCGNVRDALSNKITDKCNKFAFLVFKKIDEETGSWLKENDVHQHRADFQCIHDQAYKRKNVIREEHKLSGKQADEYEEQVPAIDVTVGVNYVSIKSGNWFDVVVGMYPSAMDANSLYDEIKDRFKKFDYMVVCQLGREIRNTLLDVEKAFFRHKWLIAIKTNFDQRMTVPVFKLKEWIERVGSKTDHNGNPNPDYILGMDKLTGWDLTMSGPFAQACVTRMFHEGSGVKVLGVENQPERPPGRNPNTKKDYDADICLECDGKKVPIQVGVREGELARKLLDSDVCPGEVIPSNETVSGGGVNMDYGKEPDFIELCKKLGQVPPEGVVLWVSFKAPLPGSNTRPLKEWYGKQMNEKCVIVWMPDECKAVIHHNNTGFDLSLAKKLCLALGDENPKEQTDSEECLTDTYMDKIINNHALHKE